MAENTNVFDPNLRPDLANIHDRHPVRPSIERVYFPEGALSQGADVNEAISIEAGKRRAIGDLIARDGDRIEGADVNVDINAGTVFISSGVLYLLGGPRSVPERLLTTVPMVGDVKIGPRLQQAVVTANQDALFLGLEPSAEESYGEPGAVRTVYTFAWGFEGDGAIGDFFPYITLRDGQVVSQDGPPTLSGVAQQIAVYDFDAHQNYIARGCTVSALGLMDGAQVFSIAEGVANILGFKVTRNAANRLRVPEDASVGIVDAEPHTFVESGDGTTTIAVNQTPIASISNVIVTKQRTVTITKGVTNSADPLPDDSISSIVSVVQGATTFPTSAYVLQADDVKWNNGATQPATGSSYQVTYRYLDAVTPISVTPTTVRVGGGVNGTTMFIAYAYKLPRVDRVCIDQFGNLSYLKGISAPVQPQPPQVPATILSLATVINDWFTTPTVINDGTKAVPFYKINRMLDKLFDALNLVTLNRQIGDINSRAPAATTGTFSDPLTSDFYRDAGEVQNGAVFGGSFQIAIDPAFVQIDAGGRLMLPFSQETVIRQDLATGCEKINPYQAFSPLPPKITISPSRDFWTDEKTIWLSDRTRVFGSGNATRVVDTDVIERSSTTDLRFLRSIPIDFTITGLGVGEVINSLKFDEVEVKPVGLPAADATGRVTGTFVIPNNVPAGTKSVEAVTGSGAKANTGFVGQGRLETTTLQEVTNVQRFQRVAQQFDRGGGSSDPDPQAQSFSFTEGRHVSSIDLKFCRIGNRAEKVLVDFVTMDNGFPTTDVFASAEIDMQAVQTGVYTRFTFPSPFFLPGGTLFAFVVKTNDPDHSIAVANRGDFDAAKQQYVAGQPYTTGTRFSSSNAVSWTVHQDSDITFALNCAVFNPSSRTVRLGTFAVTDCSDVIIRAETFLPTDQTKVVFELDFEGEPTIRILPDQVWERTSFYTGDVTVRAVLTGTSKVSPAIDRDIVMVIGTMKSTGVYVSRSWDIGSDVDLEAIMSTKLPVGSTLVVEADANNDVWTPIAQAVATPIDQGFIERTYRRNSYSAPTGGRIRLTLTGDPAARPSVADLRAFTV